MKNKQLMWVSAGLMAVIFIAVGQLYENPAIKLNKPVDNRISKTVIPESSQVIQEKALEKELTKTIVEQSLEGVIEGKSLKESLSEADYLALKESLKKTDHNYLERQILAKNKELKQFRQLFYKVLKNPSDRSGYEVILQNDKLFTEAMASLNTDMKQFEYSDQVERMIYVDFINEAITASAYLGDTRIHQIVGDIIRSEVIFDQSLPIELRKSLYVDRLEIFRRYTAAYKEYAEMLASEIPQSKYKGYLASILENNNV